MLEIQHETSHLIGKITLIHTGIYILAISPPHPGGGQFLSKLKNREEFEGGLHEKGREKGGKRRKRKVIKHTLNTFMKLK